jgi:hypothetical protein
MHYLLKGAQAVAGELVATFEEIPPRDPQAGVAERGLPHVVRGVFDLVDVGFDVTCEEIGPMAEWQHRRLDQSDLPRVADRPALGVQRRP